MSVSAASHFELLQSSPFFEGLDQAHLERFGRAASLETFAEGERIIEEGAEASAFYLLVEGKVDIAFRRASPHAPADEETEARGVEPVVPIPATSPGHLVGWSAIIEPHRYRATAVALAPTRMLVFHRHQLEAYVREHPEFGVAFMRRVLWLVGGHLQATRMRLVSRRYADGAAAIRALLDQSGPALSVSSSLHKIPHFLDNRVTLSDAFQTLDELQARGSAAERDLAALITDVLDDVRLELGVYTRLQRIYELVAGAPEGMDPEELRTESSREFCRLFSPARHVIRGEELLPDEPGHLFVMNHLSNHLDNFLPNDFILTLDTHFVSSMLLFKKYGVAPVRVVRKSQADEYGHQRFYDRLGYIYVLLRARRPGRARSRVLARAAAQALLRRRGDDAARRPEPGDLPRGHQHGDRVLAAAVQGGCLPAGRLRLARAPDRADRRRELRQEDHPCDDRGGRARAVSPLGRGGRPERR